MDNYLSVRAYTLLRIANILLIEYYWYKDLCYVLAVRFLKGVIKLEMNIDVQTLIHASHEVSIELKLNK